MITLTPDRLECLLQSIPDEVFDDYDGRVRLEGEVYGVRLPRRGTKGRRLLDGLVARFEADLVGEDAQVLSDHGVRFWRAYLREVFWGILTQGYGFASLEGLAGRGDQDTQ